MLRIFLSLMALLMTYSLITPAQAVGCGVDKDCKTASGSYRYVTPKGWNGIDPIGAVVYLHGWHENAISLLEYGDTQAIANDLGVAIILPNPLSLRWSVPGDLSGHGRDDMAFVGEALEAAERRFTLDKSKVLLAGFSHGASLVWHLACAGDTRYAGFLAVGGSFWQPLPAECNKTAAPFFHYHGEEDPRFALSGRMVNSAGVQADIVTSFAALGAGSQCSPMEVPEAKQGQLMCNLSVCRGSSTDGSLQLSSLQLCLHVGGHVMSKSWIVSVWRSLFAGRN